jgi:hypothetical protein
MLDQTSPTTAAVVAAAVAAVSLDRGNYFVFEWAKFFVSG